MVVPGLELDAVILEVHLRLQGVADLRRTWRVLRCAALCCGVLVDVWIRDPLSWFRWSGVGSVGSAGKNGVFDEKQPGLEMGIQ